MNGDVRVDVLVPDFGLAAKLILGKKTGELFSLFQVAPSEKCGKHIRLRLGIKNGDRVAEEINGSPVGIAAKQGFIAVLLPPTAAALALVAWHEKIDAGEVQREDTTIHEKECTAFWWRPKPGKLFEVPLKHFGSLIVEIPE